MGKCYLVSIVPERSTIIIPNDKKSLGLKLVRGCNIESKKNAKHCQGKCIDATFKLVRAIRINCITEKQHSCIILYNRKVREGFKNQMF